jgi:hypothetical protein
LSARCCRLRAVRLLAPIRVGAFPIYAACLGGGAAAADASAARATVATAASAAALTSPRRRETSTARWAATARLAGLLHSDSSRSARVHRAMPTTTAWARAAASAVTHAHVVRGAATAPRPPGAARPRPRGSGAARCAIGPHPHALGARRPGLPTRRAHACATMRPSARPHDTSSPEQRGGMEKCFHPNTMTMSIAS